MDNTAAVWVVIGVALLAANLPFINHRLLAVFVLKQGKSLLVRIGELAFLYGLTISLGWGLEQRLGQRAPQGWEFYAITVALFLTLAFPGFVYRYLMKHRSA